MSLGLSDAASSLFTIRDLQKDNSELTQRVAMLQSENTRLETAIKEYDQLGQALNLKERTGFDLTAARIVSVDPTSLDQALIVDRGSQSGIVTGQAVVDSSGAYVGRVTRVLKNTSEVTLISDGRSRLPAEVVETGARGIVQGQYALSVSLVEVPSGQELKSGARLVTTGFTPGVPAGLLVGFVDSVKEQGGDLFQQALVKTAADLRQLRIIFIITGTK